MKKPRKLNKRAWLNPLSSSDTGAVSVHFEVDDVNRYRNEKVRVTQKNFSVTAGFSIRDCSRTVDLDLDARHKTLDERIEKAKKIELHASLLRGRLEQAKQFLQTLPKE